MGPDPSVAAVRRAVRRALTGSGPAALAESPADLSWPLATWSWPRAPAAPTRWPWPPRWPSRPPGWACAPGGITVDHGLQPESAAQAGRVVAVLAELGLEPVRSVRVSVAGPAGPRPTGPRGGGQDGQVRRAGPGRGRRPGPRPCCSGTPWTTRPRPCCSAWLAAPGRARWPGWPSAAAGTCARCWPCAGPRPARPARRWASSRGTTRTTPTPATPGSGCAAGCFRPWKRSSGRAWPRRWPGPRASCGPTPTSWTSWPPRPPRPLDDGQPGLPAAAPGRAARGHPRPGAAGRRAGRGRPGGRARPAPRHRDRRPGHRLARAARGGPARRRSVPAAVWQAAVRAAGRRSRPTLADTA